MLNGVFSKSEDLGNDFWESGFLDKNSFVEVLQGWAKTVVVGRGRLGGIPLGIIMTENRTSEAFIPADPADSSSHEQIVQQAGGGSGQTIQSTFSFHKFCCFSLVP